MFAVEIYIMHERCKSLLIPLTSPYVSTMTGARRMVDVIDVNTQQALEMTLQQWVKYFTSEDRDDIYNVISLEFSHTKLEDMVEPPEVVSIFLRKAEFWCLDTNLYCSLFVAIIFIIFFYFPVVWFVCFTCAHECVIFIIGCVLAVKCHLML